MADRVAKRKAPRKRVLPRKRLNFKNEISALILKSPIEIITKKLIKY